MTFTRIREDGEDTGEDTADTVQVYRDLVGLPEDWTVTVEISTLAGPQEPRDAPEPR